MGGFLRSTDSLTDLGFLERSDSLQLVGFLKIDGSLVEHGLLNSFWLADRYWVSPVS